MTKPELKKLAAECGLGWAEGLGGMDDFLENFSEAVLRAAPSEDAKRLEWFDKDAGKRVFKVLGTWYTRSDYNQPYHKHPSLRAAIDAAMAAEEGEAKT